MLGRTLCALGLSLALGGCASHSDKTQPIRTALDAGRPQEALKLINESLDVDHEKELPEETSGDNALLLLDRAMVLQSLQNYKLSSRDLEVSDKQIEVLDLSRNAAHEIGKYLFSDDVGPYKSPPYEKLMINSMNMVNYLSRGDLGGARVEARRLAVLQKFIDQSEGQGRGLIGLGSYLAGFTFEKSGRADIALKYYDEAIAYSPYASLAEPVRRLSAQTAYSSPNLKKFLESQPAGSSPAPAPAPAPAPLPSGAAASGAAPAGAPAAEAAEADGELLVIIGYGRVPEKIAKRIPIGLALTYASMFMSPAQSAQANRLAAQGLVTWVNYPELAPPRRNYPAPSFAVDGRLQPLDGVLAVDVEARRAWEDAKGAVIAAAITRMVARVIAGEATRQAASDSTVGMLLSLGTQATLTAMDTPDTRSWETLPARIAIGRLRLPPGKHDVVITVGGRGIRRPVTLTANGFAVATLTVLQ